MLAKSCHLQHSQYQTITAVIQNFDLHTTVRLAVERGEIEAQHPLADGPWLFNRETLQTAAAATLIERVTDRNRRPAIPNTEQAIFEFSNT
jgi:hypothetical protein